MHLLSKISIPSIFCLSVIGNPVLLEDQSSVFNKFAITTSSNLAVNGPWFLALLFQKIDFVHKRAFKLYETIRRHVRKKPSALFSGTEHDSKSPSHVRAELNETEFAPLSNQRLEHTIQVYKEGKKSKLNGWWLSIKELSKYFMARAFLLVSGRLDEVKTLAEPVPEISSTISPDQMPKLITLPAADSGVPEQEAVSAARGCLDCLNSMLNYVRSFRVDPALIDFVLQGKDTDLKLQTELERIFFYKIHLEDREPFSRQLHALIRDFREVSVLFLDRLAYALAQVPSGERESFVGQLQGLVAERLGNLSELYLLANVLREVPLGERERFIRQLQVLAADRPGSMSTLYELAHGLHQMSFELRTEFVCQLQGVITGRLGTLSDVYFQARALHVVSMRARNNFFIMKLQRLTEYRHGSMNDLAWLTDELLQVPWLQLMDFIEQLQGLVRDRAGDIENIRQLINTLRTIEPDRRVRIIRTLEPTMTIMQAARHLQEFAAPAVGATQIHQLAAKEMPRIYCSLREIYAGELVSEEEALRLLRGWINSHVLIDSVHIDRNRQLMRDLLAHKKWFAAMGMGFTNLEYERSVSGAELLRLVVTYIRNTPEGSERDAKISQLLEQGLLDAINAYGDSSTLDHASCVAGIAERLLLAFRDHQKLNANDLAAKLQRIEAIQSLMNLGYEPIPTNIAESLKHIPKEDLAQAWKDALEKLLAEHERILHAEGHERGIIQEAMCMIREQLDISDQDATRVWSMLHS